MNVLEAVEKRRSIRKYLTKPVEDEKLKAILEAGRLGPSAANKQPCHIIVVTKPDARQSMKDAYKADWFTQAPAIILVCADPKEAWCRKDGEEYWKVDAAICMQNIVLASTELELGTCWIAAFDEKGAKKALNIPEEIRVVGMTPLGYPAEEKGPANDRKPLEKSFYSEELQTISARQLAFLEKC